MSGKTLVGEPRMALPHPRTISPRRREERADLDGSEAARATRTTIRKLDFKSFILGLPFILLIGGALVFGVIGGLFPASSNVIAWIYGPICAISTIFWIAFLISFQIGRNKELRRRREEEQSVRLSALAHRERLEAEQRIRAEEKQARFNSFMRLLFILVIVGLVVAWGFPALKTVLVPVNASIFVIFIILSVPWLIISISNKIKKTVAQSKCDHLWCVYHGYTAPWTNRHAWYVPPVFQGGPGSTQPHHDEGQKPNGYADNLSELPKTELWSVKCDKCGAMRPSPALNALWEEGRLQAQADRAAARQSQGQGGF
jgi:hypothetical protein